MQIDPNTKLKRKRKRTKLSKKDQKKLKKMCSNKIGKNLKHIKNPMDKIINEKSVFSSGKLFINRRVFIGLDDLRACSMDYLYSSKNKRKSIRLHPFPLISPVSKKGGNSTPNTSKIGEIRFMDISYILFEVRKDISFPKLKNIMDPYKEKEIAITLVGSEYDRFDKKLIKRDLKMIKDNLPWVDTEFNVYRIRRRTFVKMMDQLDEYGIHLFLSETIGDKTSDLVNALRAENYDNRIFFQYVISAHVVMKNSDVYYAHTSTPFQG